MWGGSGATFTNGPLREQQLQAAGVPTRVASMPSVEWFEEQDQGYKDSVLPLSVKARASPSRRASA